MAALAIYGRPIKGILFLDEIGELPLMAQTRLLRVLQDKCVTPVGSHVAEPVDFHVLVASNRDLQHMVAEGTFREDLFFRINGYQVQLPPLREYTYEEFCALVRRLLVALSGPLAEQMDEPLLHHLFAQDWPGNIRQLRQMLEVAVVLAEGQPLNTEHFPGLMQPTQPEKLAGGLKKHGEEYVRLVLASCNGNISAAARQLGISRTTLYAYLK